MKIGILDKRRTPKMTILATKTASIRGDLLREASLQSKQQRKTKGYVPLYNGAELFFSLLQIDTYFLKFNYK